MEKIIYFNAVIALVICVGGLHFLASKNFNSSFNSVPYIGIVVVLVLLRFYAVSVIESETTKSTTIGIIQSKITKYDYEYSYPIFLINLINDNSEYEYEGNDYNDLRFGVGDTVVFHIQTDKAGNTWPLHFKDFRRYYVRK